MDGGGVWQPKLVVEKDVTYAPIPRRKAKTAALRRLPGRAKDGLLIRCFKSIEILVKRLRMDGRCAQFSNTFEQRSPNDHVGAGSTSL
jgi:hypothetical protein